MFEIRSLTLGELLDESFVLFRGAWARLIAFQIIAFVPTALAEVAIISAMGDVLIDLIRQRPDATEGPAIVALGGAVSILMVQVIVAPVVGVALTRAVADTYLSKAWTLRQLVDVAVAYALRAIAAGVILFALLLVTVTLPTAVAGGAAWAVWNTGTVDGAAAVLLIVVAALVAGLPIVAGVVYVNLRFTLAYIALVIEDVSVLMAFRRSAELMRGRYWAGLGLWLILLLVGLLFGFAVSAFVPSPAFETLDPDQIRQMLPLIVRSQIVSTLLSEAMGMLTRTFAVIAWTLFYFSARCEREGFDLMMLARRFATDPPRST